MVLHVPSASPSRSHGSTTEERAANVVESASPAWTNAAEAPRAGYGILVFCGSSGKVLYANETASRFLCMADENATPFLPAVTELVRQMTAWVEIGTDERPPFETRRLVTEQGTPVLLQAFAIRDRFGTGRSRVVITMQGSLLS